MLPERTLEETVYDYIERFQMWENGQGVGVSCDDLNKNIVHPHKQTGRRSEAKFLVVLRNMPSLIESEQKWNGKAVFQLNEQQSSRENAKEIICTVTHDIRSRLQALHHRATCVSFTREEGEHILEDLSAAYEFLELEDN